MIGVGAVYLLLGLVFAAVALLSAGDRANPRRVRNLAFWGLLSLSFLGGDRLGDFGNGLLVLALVTVGGVWGLGIGKPATTTHAERQVSSARRGNWLFLPALVIPATALAGTLFLKPLVQPGQVTLVSLALGVVIALTMAMLWLRPPLSAPLQEARRLFDSVGWAVVLPQMLAALGAVFALAGVGHAVGDLFARWLPGDSRLVAVIAYTLGMAVFTIVMGNAFAAFPVMTAGIGMPLIVQRFGGDPAVMGAMGMLSGFCGTLLTPMAANYNLVPVALLELSDRWAVIKVQAPTALIMLLVNTVLMYALVFRHWPS